MPPRQLGMLRPKPIELQLEGVDAFEFIANIGAKDIVNAAHNTCLGARGKAHVGVVFPGEKLVLLINILDIRQRFQGARQRFLEERF